MKPYGCKAIAKRKCGSGGSDGVAFPIYKQASLMGCLVIPSVKVLSRMPSKKLLSPFLPSSLPGNELKNCCPVSGLCFLSKLVEQIVAKQLMSHISSYKLDNPHLSAYKLGPSIETALLFNKNEVQLSLAQAEPTSLVLLDLSAAFDTIDHTTLFGYLKSWLGLSGTILKWFVFYLSNRCQANEIGSTLS